jgi:peptidoglycan hydrolase-like protein with peptidoglycan-binding domain
MQCTGIAQAARCAGVLTTLVLIVMPAAPAAAEAGQVSASKRLLIAAAGWHGRPIRHPHRHAVPTASAERPPRGWEAGPVALGAGTHRPSGSRRVRELQRRLTGLGYRPGPIDGIFGVRTRAAVAWFQVKHGFHVDGRATLAVVRHLRDRARSSAPTDVRVSRPPEAAPSWDAFRQLVGVGPAAAQPDSDGPSLWWLAALLLLAFAIGFAGVALLQRTRRQLAPAAPPQLDAPRALGYARVRSAQRVKAHANTIAAHAAEHGMALTGLITDDDADERRGGDRPGLGYALEQLRSGEADCLVVGRIGHLTHSPAELVELLDVMSERETPLVVLNTGPSIPRWSVPGHAVGRGRFDAG